MRIYAGHMCACGMLVCLMCWIYLAYWVYWVQASWEAGKLRILEGKGADAPARS